MRTGASSGPSSGVSGNAGAWPAGEQQVVLLAVGNLQLVEDSEQQLAPRVRAAGLDEAQMPGRDPGLERELQLAHPAPAAPVAQRPPDACVCRRGGHAGEL